jgi:hypothetical protein
MNESSSHKRQIKYCHEDKLGYTEKIVPTSCINRTGVANQFKEIRGCHSVPVLHGHTTSRLVPRRETFHWFWVKPTKVCCGSGIVFIWAFEIMPENRPSQYVILARCGTQLHHKTIVADAYEERGRAGRHIPRRKEM